MRQRAVFIQHGADLTARDGAGRTPLAVADLAGRGEVVEWLRRAGAAP